MKNRLFYLLVLYYIVFNYLLLGEVRRFSVTYFFLTLPIVGFVCLYWKFLIAKYSKVTLSLLCFLISIWLISLFRLDFSTILSGTMLAGMLIVIVNARLELQIRTINGFYLLCLLGSIISFHAGYNVYGYIPDLAAIKEILYGGAGPRISLFPLVPESGFFSVFIIIVNYYFNHKKSRFLFYGLGAYFVAFSGSRTTFAVFLFFIAFEVICRLFQFRNRFLFRYLSLGFVLAFVVIINLKELHLYISRSDNELLKAMLLRDQGKSISTSSDVRDVATRMWIWDQHLRIYARSPLFGVGTYEFSDYVVQTKNWQFTSGSESFFTSWLARVGLAMVFFVLFLRGVHARALAEQNRFAYFMCFFFFLVMISYGSFVVPYNFMFLLTAVALGSRQSSDNDITETLPAEQLNA